ncbi:MAG: hypothetical protein IJH04_10995, partial [Eggerthellaceae bacterium]|nr:hypothetical protein [Eggerthellaceae bacterium]
GWQTVRGRLCHADGHPCMHAFRRGKVFLEQFATRFLCLHFAGFLVGSRLVTMGFAKIAWSPEWRTEENALSVPYHGGEAP